MTHSIPSTRRRVGVVSSAQTDWRSAWSGAQHIDLISAAVQQALEGSGLRIEDDRMQVFRVNMFPNESASSLFKKTSPWYRRYYRWKRGK